MDIYYVPMSYISIYVRKYKKEISIMNIKFNVSVSISGLAVNSNDKRFYQGVVEKEHSEDNHLDSLSINLDGSCEMEASETKEFILGIVDAVKTAAEVKMTQQKSDKPAPEKKDESNQVTAEIKEDAKND